MLAYEMLESTMFVALRKTHTNSYGKKLEATVTAVVIKCEVLS